MQAVTILFTMLFVLLLTSRPAHASNCVPGAQSQCACPGGGTGVQICSDDGSRVGACSSCTVIQSQPMQSMQPMYSPYPPQSPMRRRSAGLWGGGLALMILGAVLLPVSTGMIIFGSADGGCDKHNDDTVCTAGGGLLGLGLLSLGGGITMMIIGGRKVPLDETRQQAWWIPTPQVSPRGGALTWTF